MQDEKIFVPKTFAVIGAGPSGCILAAFLAKGGYDVILCDVLDDLINPALDRGIILDGSEEFEQKVKYVCNNILDLKNWDIDVVFIATKATSLGILGESITSIHKNNFYIVSWQNGIDTEFELAKYVSKKWIMRAVVNYGCSLKGAAHSHISFHHYPHYIQEMDISSKDVSKKLASIMTSSGLLTKRTNDIKSMLWRKAILNASMNPVCAVTGLTMYQAMREPYVYDIVDSLLKECIMIAKANGVYIEEGFYDHAIDYMSNAGNHKPSMLMDIENRRITEIDYINGKFEEYGILKGQKTSYNSIFKGLVKAKELIFSKKI